MSKLHKFLSILLAVMMVISIVPITASATASDDWEYQVISEENKTAEITKYTGSATELVTPTEIDGYKVVSIANHAFEEHPTIVSVIISEGVTSVGRCAFNKCEALLHVALPKGVTKISYGTFSWCFKLRSVAIPDTVTIIEEYAFNLTFDLQSVIYSGTKEQWEQITIKDDGIDFKDATVYYGCESNNSLSGTCGNNAFWEVNVVSGVLTIFGTGEMKDYTSSGKPWYGCRNIITSVVVYNGITRIGRYAFSYCDRMTSVSIPESVSSISSDAFYKCPKLEKIVVDSNNQYFSNDENGILFDKDKTLLHHFPNGNGIKDYTVPQTVKIIGGFAFRGSDIESVTIPDSVTDIYGFAFNECKKLKSVIMGNGVKSIGDRAFMDCTELSKLVIGNSLENLGMEAFANCDKITRVVLPGTLKTMGLFPFFACEGLKTVTIHDGVTTLGTSMFIHCSSLHSIYIPATVTTISDHVFMNCTGLRDIYFAGTPEQWDAISKEPIASYVTVHFNITHFHEYKGVVTEPTCTEKGYTTYICECGDSYVEDYVNVISHSLIKYERVALVPTCTKTGEKEMVERCSSCNKVISRKTVTLPALGHTPAEAVEENYVAPTCTENGSKDVVVYCSVCDEEISRETITIDATGHADNDGNGYCDSCPELLDPSVECDHACHRGDFFWKITLFFNKLFKINQYCECGVAHY